MFTSLNMEFSVATKLIAQALDTETPNQMWADLGAGSGLFTQALASLLKSPSQIFALDKNERELNSIHINNTGIHLEKISGDITQTVHGLPLVNGFLIANTLHYIPQQKEFLDVLKSKLRTNGVLILIEYDLEKSNPWVPYPLSIRKLPALVKDSGFTSFEIMHEQPSRLNNSNIYSAWLKP